MARKLCLLCKKNHAQVPDRNMMGRPIKRLCRECHRERLREDLEYIKKLRERCKKMIRSDEEILKEAATCASTLTQELVQLVKKWRSKALMREQKIKQLEQTIKEHEKTIKDLELDNKMLLVQAETEDI